MKERERKSQKMADQLIRVYDDVLAKGPFPTGECAAARIDGKLHGELIIYLADIAGLASRGHERLASLSEQEKTKFRGLASTSLYEKLPGLQQKITLSTTPKLHVLIESTERARLLILRILDS